MFRYLLGIIVVLAVFGFSLYAIREYNAQDKAALVTIMASDTVLLRGTAGDYSVITAVTPADRERGLSRMTTLGQNIGMLFVFDSSDYHSFWMKEMNFPIDIIWMDETFKIVDIKKNVAPETYPETFVSRGRAKHVFEARAGFADEWGLSAGKSMDFYIKK